MKEDFLKEDFPSGIDTQASQTLYAYDSSFPHGFVTQNVGVDDFGQISENFFVLASESFEISDFEAWNHFRFLIVQRKSYGLYGAVLTSSAQSFCCLSQ